MKLLYCDLCYDVVSIKQTQWKTCDCGKCGGQYNPDNLTATIGGKCRVFGIANMFFMKDFPKDVTQLPEYRKKYQYAEHDSECWWGEFEGDWQLIRVRHPLGPIPRDWQKRVMKLVPGGQLYSWKITRPIRGVKGSLESSVMQNPAASREDLYARSGVSLIRELPIITEQGEATIVPVRWCNGEWIEIKRRKR